jgi:uncharacterized membrane protein YqjE
MVKSSDTREGVVQSLKSAWASVLDGLHDRADLLSIELEQAKRQLLGDLLVVLALSTCLLMTFASLNVLLFVVFWDERVELSVALCAAYAVASLILTFIARRRRRLAPRILGSTIDELRKDSSIVAGR